MSIIPSKENRDWSTFKVKVEPQFPTNYIECCRLIDIDEEHQCNYGYCAGILDSFQKLIIARDAWWKIDNNWKPDWSKVNKKYIIVNESNHILFDGQYFDCDTNHVLAFRTQEIRDKFLETFRDLIEDCKELI